MGSPQERFRKFAWMIMPILAVVIAFGYIKYGGSITLHSRDTEILAISENLNQVISEADNQELSLSLLTDSILSIVQSYYVDSPRVTNLKIVSSTLENMNLIPGVQSHYNKKQNIITLKIFEDETEYQLTTPYTYSQVLETFENVATFIDQSEPLIEDRNSGKRISGSILVLNSLLTALDAHSSLLSPEAYRELRQGTEGSFGGLGVLVGIRNQVLTVIKPLPRSPALRVGIQKDDKILGINGIYTYGYTLDNLVEHMRGEPGSEVNLSLLRKGDDYPRSMKLNREIINVDSVEAGEITYGDSKILHLTVESFASRTSKEILNAIKVSKARNNGINGLILDLRNNPGGLLDQAVQVVDLFIKSGVIVSTKGRHQEVEVADTGFDETDFPIAILINGDSASASEIVAGALQDHNRAVVIGQPSFGKGSVQTIFELPSERALKLTIARYYTPLGRSIQNVGIMPDVWIQPVIPGEDNVNLFGEYRYKNERYLRNHLSAKKQNTFMLDEPTHKYFYLKSKETTDLPEDIEGDIEMQAAITVLHKMAKTYGKPMPESVNRSSHWLALAAPELDRQFKKMNRKVNKWLSKEHKVSWNKSTEAFDTSKLTLQISKAEEPEVASVKLGEYIEIPWYIANNNNSPVNQISVFVRSEESGFATEEVLLGSISSGATKSGLIKFKIPTYAEPGLHNFRVGLAVGAWPVGGITKQFAVNILDRSMANLQATIKLVNEKGGKIPGVLEPKEKATIQIIVTNTGASDATDIDLKLDNISGKQIRLPVQSNIAKNTTIKKGASRTYNISVSGSSNIFSSDIGIGLYLDSSDLKIPVVSRTSIRGLPNKRIENISNLIAH